MPSRSASIVRLLAIITLLIAFSAIVTGTRAGLDDAAAPPSVTLGPTGRLSLGPHGIPKKGLGYSGNDLCGSHLGIEEIAEEAVAVNAGWLFTWWHQFPPSAAELLGEAGDLGIDVVPMIYSPEEIAPDLPCPELDGDSDWLLTFNEPEVTLGSTDLSSAVAAWRRLETCYPDKMLVTPGLVTGWGYWLDRFVAAYEATYGELPRMDALGLHCYGFDDHGRAWWDNDMPAYGAACPRDDVCPAYPDDSIISTCQAALDYARTQLDRWEIDGGIVVNEYGGTLRTAEASERLLVEMTLLLEQDPDVARYAWWTWRYDGCELWSPDWDADGDGMPDLRCQLLDGASGGTVATRSLFACDANEVLTPLGEHYANPVMPAPERRLFVPLVVR